MNKIYGEDLQRCLDTLPGDVKLLLRKKDFVGKVFIAGGFIRAVLCSERIKDIDIFVSNSNLAQIVENYFNDGKVEISKTKNAITIKRDIPIQIITRWVYSTPKELIDKFDFTICQAVIYSESEEDCVGDYEPIIIGGCSEDFYKDLMSKQLKYTSPERDEDVMASIFRLLKFKKLGYNITYTSLFKIIARAIKSLDLSQYDENKIYYSLNVAFSQVVPIKENDDY